MSSSDIFNTSSQHTAATTISFDIPGSGEPVSAEIGNYAKFRISGAFAVEAKSIHKNLVYGLPVDLLEGYFDGTYTVDVKQLPLMNDNYLQIHSWEVNLRNSEHTIVKTFRSHVPYSKAKLEIWGNFAQCKFIENNSFLQLAFAKNFRGIGKVNVSKDVYGEAASLAVFLHDDWGEGTINVVSGKSEPFSDIVSRASKARRKLSSRIKNWLWN